MNNNLGVIANSHLATADNYGPLSTDAIRFAEAHNVAVDFFKTGLPVDRRSLPRVQRRPDFMGKVVWYLGVLTRNTEDVGVDRPECRTV
jgi:hypothetical protein